MNAGYNILIIGIESMSRLNFKRTMPLTSRFLKDRGSIQMLGYNKLGYNSFPNLFPILTGKSFKNVTHECKTGNVINTNKCQFIWDAFKIAGYKTILGSDSIAGLLGTYEYSLKKIPTDFYLQPVMFEIGNLFQHKDYNFHACFNNKYFYKVLLDYIEGITKHLKSTNWFGMFWEESVSHEDIDLPTIMDNDYVHMLENLSDYLNDTVLIFLSDHGMRWGKLAKTKNGRQEERLPLLEVLFPKRFQNEYPIAFNNFKVNSNRLITPYDLHETLLDLTKIDNLQNSNLSRRLNLVNSKTNKSSLFLPISEKRTCPSIGIEDHWCTCSLGQRIKITKNIRLSASRYLVSHINKLLSAYPQCDRLSLKQIININAVQAEKDKGKIFTIIILLT
ncbi:uncharacterized protein LOC119190252 [Manduca sexta]|uniref:uncharacterized protein LOC119190252 n=1 Tax=Manduca sexta TaxID=7130 RepID=UPI00188F5A75|nr:uncharacterized protein LOC119190252 [Manduca sexta]